MGKTPESIPTSLTCNIYANNLQPGPLPARGRVRQVVAGAIASRPLLARSGLNHRMARRYNRVVQALELLHTNFLTGREFIQVALHLLPYELGTGQVTAIYKDDSVTLIYTRAGVLILYLSRADGILYANFPWGEQQDFFVPIRKGTQRKASDRYTDDIKYFRDKLVSVIKIPKTTTTQAQE